MQHKIHKILCLCIAILVIPVLLSCGNQPSKGNSDTILGNTSINTTSIENQVPDDKKESVSDETISNNEVNNNPFYLLQQAFVKTKSQLLLIFELLLILLLVLSLILYIAEHIAQPTIYKHYPKSLLWTFVKSIQDPGEMAPPRPISIVGRIVANIIGLAGVAMFALPAGIISSGFISAMDDEKEKVELITNANKINELMLIKSVSREGLYWPAKNKSFGDLMLELGLSEEEILKAVKSNKNLRMKNLSAVVNDGPKSDMLVVNQFYSNTPYGSHVERGSSITIVCPIGEGDNGLSFFDWHIAQLGGFNYVANEYFSRQNVNEIKRCNLYTIDEESEANPYFLQFVDDITRNRSENDWIIVIAGEQVVKNITDYHFEFGGEKGETRFDFPECITHDRVMLKHLFDDFNKTMEEKVGLKTDAHQVQPRLKDENITRYIQARTQANVLLITVSYDLMVFGKSVHSAIYNFADVLNRNLENKKPVGLHNEEYLVRPIKSDYWKKLYGVGF